MGQKFAVLDWKTGIVVFYDSIDSPPPSGIDAIEIADAQWQTCLSDPGWTIMNGELVAPAQPTAAQVAAAALLQSAQTAFAAGIAITSTGTAAINGTYAVDQVSQMDIIAIETSINAGKGFPGGAAAFNYPDTSGVIHTFSESNFTDFAAAVRDYVYSLKSVIAGGLSALPASTVTIA